MKAMSVRIFEPGYQLRSDLSPMASIHLTETTLS
jgi:hypothetical protein